MRLVAEMGVLSPKDTQGGDLLVIPLTGEPYVVREDSPHSEKWKQIGTVPGDTLASFTTSIRKTMGGLEKLAAVPRALRSEDIKEIFEIFSE